MKTKIALFAGVALVAMGATTSCENENINPLDYAAKTDTIVINNGGGNTLKTAVAEYPAGSLVWSHDTTLTESVKVPVGQSLYIEPGVTVTCKSGLATPIELVVLGNLYCMGTEEKPVTFTSDTKKPADWGGIICGYDAEEVVLNHVDIAYGGATPTESSLSFQNKLFKTEIDGGVPAFHFCNTNGRFAIVGCFFHDNYNDQTYFTGGNAVIRGNVFADSGNAADGGEAINVKSGCNMDIAYNIIYNACTNAFKLSNGGVSETIKGSELRIYNNTMIDCGWRRSKNKKGGSIWLEKGIAPQMVNNLVYDCRFGMRQNNKDGADLDNSVLAPNFFFASTQDGIDQMSGVDDKMAVRLENSIYSATPGDKNPMFVNFSQNSNMNINCEDDDPAKGAPLPFDKNWNFCLQTASPALTGGVSSLVPLFTNGLAFMGMKKVNFLDAANDQNYYFFAGAPSAFFGARGIN